MSIRPRLSDGFDGGSRLLTALLLVGMTLFVLHLLNLNPRDYAYLPLLPAVAIFLGGGPALVAVVVSTIIADYVYALPE